MVDPEYIVLTDLDGTLTKSQSSWRFVMEELGIWETHGKIHLEKFLNNEINYNKFLDLDVSSWKGESEENFLKILEKIKFRPGVVELFKFFLLTNAKIYIISSGIMDLAIRAKKLFLSSNNFSHESIIVLANIILKENGLISGKFIKQVGWNDELSKDKITSNILNSINNQVPIIGLGDTISDLPLIMSSDLSFSCFSENKDLNSSATVIINQEDGFFTIKKIIENFLKDKLEGFQ